MRYYVKSKRPSVDYSHEDYQPCWTCKKACGGCSWSRSFTPVKGWKAEPSFIPSNGEFSETYKIIECPLYEKEERC